MLGIHRVPDSVPARTVGRDERREASPSTRSNSALAAPADASRIELMRISLADHGGLITADSLIHKLRARSDQPISTLARWIVEREILSFAHHGETLIPAFQFDRVRPVVRAEVSTALRELLVHGDEWDAVAWFVEPNAWLDEAPPIHALETRPADVLPAARAWRFATRG